MIEVIGDMPISHKYTHKGCWVALEPRRDSIRSQCPLCGKILNLYDREVMFRGNFARIVEEIAYERESEHTDDGI